MSRTYFYNTGYSSDVKVATPGITVTTISEMYRYGKLTSSTSVSVARNPASVYDVVDYRDLEDSTITPIPNDVWNNYTSAQKKAIKDEHLVDKSITCHHRTGRYSKLTYARVGRPVLEKVIFKPGGGGSWTRTTEIYELDTIAHTWSFYQAQNVGSVIRPWSTPLQISEKFAYLFSDSSLIDVKNLSILNFLIEIKDILSVKSLFKWPKKFRKYWADSSLNIMFNIIPTKADIEAMFDIATTLKSKVDKWNASVNKGNLHSVHATMFKVSETNSYETTLNLGLGVVGIARITEVKTQREKISAKFKPGEISQIDFDPLVKNLSGLDNLPGVAWEAIPFSFLVDWFFHIREKIDNLVNTKPIIKKQVLSGCLSQYQTIEQRISITAYCWKDTIYEKSYVYPTIINSTSRYVRTPYGIVPPSSFKVDGIQFDKDQSLTHAYLMTALASNFIK